MKTIAIVVSLLAALGASALLTHCGGLQTRAVSAANIAELPAGKTLEVDLTRKGTVYEFNDPGTDFSRVSVRTTAGVKPFAEQLKESNTSLRGGLVLGRPGDMRLHLPPLVGDTTTSYDCGVFCKCDDTTDCVDLILSGKCGDDMWCSSTTSACFCTAKL
ncbi:MAG: hypothetical protein ACYC42_07365 [Lysobacter sp.]